MTWPPEAFWLAVAVAFPSLAIMIAGYRNSVVADLKSEIEALRDQVNRLRQDNEWLIRQARRLTGETPPRRPDSEM
jgi:hypothetical protein